MVSGRLSLLTLLSERDAVLRQQEVTWVVCQLLRVKGRYSHLSQRACWVLMGLWV